MNVFILLILFLISKSCCFAQFDNGFHDGINVDSVALPQDTVVRVSPFSVAVEGGGGFHYDFIYRPIGQQLVGGAVLLVGIEIGFDMERRWRGYANYFQWFSRYLLQDNTLSNLRTGKILTIGFRYSFLSDNDLLRPSISIGGVPLIIFTWDIGAAVDIALVERVLWARAGIRQLLTLFPGLIDPGKDQYYPSMTSLGLLYRF